MRHYHLIGIGGIGMSAIARLLYRQGNVVTGSDIKESKITQELKDEGIEVFIGHRPENLKNNVEIVVYSSAIKEDNPEIKEAKRRNLPVLKRAQILAELMKDSTVITVTGSHGKTTTTSLICYFLSRSGLNPTMAIGGILREIDQNAYLGEKNFFVAEADESDGSFLYYFPTYSIITNIDYEHIDYYKNFESLLDAFKKFIGKTKKLVIAYGEDLNLARILKESKVNYILYGLNPKEEIEFYPSNIKIEPLFSEFDLFRKNKFVDHFKLNLLGEHNILNSLAVIALGLELNLEIKKIKQALATFPGVKRRLDFKYKSSNYIIIDDYAHHPTEIMATLKAISPLNKKRIIVIFQPHRYTRTKLLFHRFVEAFELADVLVLSDIYSAGETPLEEVSSYLLYEEIKRRNPQKEIFFLKKEKIVDFILEILSRGDLIITLGAGDITYISDELAQRIREKD